MTFKQSKYSQILKHRTVVLPFGEFFLCDSFVVAELRRGIHFDWNKVQQVIDILIQHYGHDLYIGYISNRINPYSIEPTQWNRFHAEYDFIVAVSVVYYNRIGLMNATMEKGIVQNSLKRSTNLDEAINWMLNIREFNLMDSQPAWNKVFK